jgi:hypothetical protein
MNGTICGNSRNQPLRTTNQQMNLSATTGCGESVAGEHGKVQAVGMRTIQLPSLTIFGCRGTCLRALPILGAMEGESYRCVFTLSLYKIAGGML